LVLNQSAVDYLIFKWLSSRKREYLLAQLREKDSLIQSLLKQLHNPHLATPLAMANLRTNAPHRSLPLSSSHPKGKIPPGSGLF